MSKKPNDIIVMQVNDVVHPQEYNWFLNGLHGMTYRLSCEDSTQFWNRTLNHISEMRNGLARTHTALDRTAPVTVYAGALPPAVLDELKKHHMKQHVLDRLLQIGNQTPRRRGDATASIQALRLFTKLTGIDAPAKPAPKPAPADQL